MRLHPSHATRRARKTSEGRQSADRRTIHGRTAQTNVAIRPRFRARQRATDDPRKRTIRHGRARLSALCKRRLSRRPNALTQPRPRFTRSSGCRRYPHHRPRLSDAPRAPVVVPEGTMPGPPGDEVTSSARRNRTRPINRLSPVTSLRWARFGTFILYKAECQDGPDFRGHVGARRCGASCVESSS
jgi:hypothetical protein